MSSYDLPDNLANLLGIKLSAEQNKLYASADKLFNSSAMPAKLPIDESFNVDKSAFMRGLLQGMLIDNINKKYGGKLSYFAFYVNSSKENGKFGDDMEEEQFYDIMRALKKKGVYIEMTKGFI
jgi:hypothetical protein